MHEEGGLKGRTVYWAIGIGGVLIAAAIITLYTPWLGLFNLRVIVVRGNHHITAEEAARVSGLRNGGPLARLPIRRAEMALETLPWVKQAKITRVYPHTVRITITERIPIAALQRPDGHSYLVIGADGVIVAEKEEVDYLIVDGVSVTAARPGGRVRDPKAIATLACLREKGFDAFTRVDFSDPTGVVLHSPSGAKVLLGPVAGACARIEELAALLPTINLADYRSIDLRFGGEAILVPSKVVNR